MVTHDPPALGRRSSSPLPSARLVTFCKHIRPNSHYLSEVRGKIGQLTDVSECKLQHDLLRKRHRVPRHGGWLVPAGEPARGRPPLVPGQARGQCAKEPDEHDDAGLHGRAWPAQ